MSIMVVIAGFFASLLDPFRWVICGLSVWFIPNFPAALVVGIFAPLIMTFALSGSEQSSIPSFVIISQILASIAITWILHKIKNKKSTSKADSEQP